MSDILIIGGGVAGLTAAARLAPLGTVTLLEAEDSLGYHASGRSAALFEESYGNPVVRALNRAARAGHEAAGVLSPRGFLLVGLPEEAEAFERDAQAMGVERIGLVEALGLVPILRDDLALFAWDEAAQDIDTDRLLQGAARTARAAGAAILTGERVTGISRENGRWRVTTDRADHEAETIVNAAGAWADGVARMAGVAPLGLTPYRRSMARIPAPEGLDVARWPMLFGPGETWYAKPDAGALIVSPAEEDPSEPMDAWADDMVIAEGLDRYEKRVTAPVTRLLTTWAGLRTFAPDRVLVVGRDAAEPSFFWLAGQGGYGFQTAPAVAQLVADLLGDRKPEFEPEMVERLSPGRFA